MKAAALFVVGASLCGCAHSQAASAGSSEPQPIPIVRMTSIVPAQPLPVPIAVAAEVSESSASEPPIELPPARYPVRWSARIAVKDVADLESELGKTLKPNGKPLVLVQHAESDTSRNVQNCRDYLQAKSDGFLADTPDTLAQEAFFQARCRPLTFLQKARPSNVSHVNEIRLDKDPLSVLPASLNPDPEVPTAAQEEALASFGSLRQYAPRLMLGRRAPLSVELLDSVTRTTTWVEVIAWGDYDYDGIEDVLLFEESRAPEGEYRLYDHIVLTRRNAEDLLRVIHRER